MQPEPDIKYARNVYLLPARLCSGSDATATHTIFHVPCKTTKCGFADFVGNGAMSQGPQSKIRKPECVEKENVRGSTIRSKCDRAHQMREINGV